MWLFVYSLVEEAVSVIWLFFLSVHGLSFFFAFRFERVLTKLNRICLELIPFSSYQLPNAYKL
jgi:hypothetical protein